MSGDNAPHEIIRGALAGAAEYGVSLVLVGDIATVKGEIDKYEGEKPDYRVVHTDSVVTMDDAPGTVMKEKSDSSLAVAVKLLADGEGDALVSAANTGALFTASSLTLRRFKGIRRAALGAIIPLERPFLLLDSGANVDIMPEQLLSFARMGSVYAKTVMDIERPTVALLNNGTEKMKGTDVCRDAYKMLSESELYFCGNVEACDLPKGKYDVVVTDGFTGNIAIKAIEGMADFALGRLKRTFAGSLRGKIASLFVRKDLMEMKASFDPGRYGGAPFFGITKPVIKVHGASHETAVQRTIGQAVDFIKAVDMMKEIEY